MYGPQVWRRPLPAQNMKDVKEKPMLINECPRFFRIKLLCHKNFGEKHQINDNDYDKELIQSKDILRGSYMNDGK